MWSWHCIGLVVYSPKLHQLMDWHLECSQLARIHVCIVSTWIQAQLLLWPELEGGWYLGALAACWSVALMSNGNFLSFRDTTVLHLNQTRLQGSPLNTSWVAVYGGICIIVSIEGTNRLNCTLHPADQAVCTCTELVYPPRGRGHLLSDWWAEVSKHSR